MNCENCKLRRTELRGLGLGLLLCLIIYGLPVVLAQTVADHPVRQAEAKQVYSITATVVNLPGGEKFVAFGPKLGDIQTYITEKRPTGESPRRLTIHRPGGTPLSWDVYLYIQEH